jgi:hypothetical protein
MTQWNDPIVIIGIIAILLSLFMGVMQVILWLSDRRERMDTALRELKSLVDAAAREFVTESARSTMVVPPPLEKGKINQLINSPLFFRTEILDEERNAFRQAEQILFQPARYLEDVWMCRMGDILKHNKLCDDVELQMFKIRPLLTRLHVPAKLESPTKIPQPPSVEQK